MKIHKNMKNKVILKKRFSKFARNIPFGLYIVFVSSLLVGVIILFCLLLKKFNSELEDTLYVQLIVGLVASVLSFILCLNGILSKIIDKTNAHKKKREKQYKKASLFIQDFNDNIMTELTLVNRVILRVEAETKFNKRFEPLFNNQNDLVKEYEMFLTSNHLVHDDILLFAISTILYTNNVLIGNTQMTQFAESVIRAKNTGSTSVSTYVKTIGGSELFTIFNQSRIKVLNFFERLAVEYVNESVAEELINTQFEHILNRVSSMFYYYIYKGEGLDSYPYLNVMLQKMHIDK